MPAGEEKEVDKLLQQAYKLLDKVVKAAGPVVGGRHAAVLLDMGNAGFKRLVLATARREALGLLEVLQPCDSHMIVSQLYQQLVPLTPPGGLVLM